MSRTTTLAVDVATDAGHVFDILSDLEVDVTTEAGKLVRMRVTSGFPFWEGSTWEWELGPATRAESGTGVLFRHHGFAEGYPESDHGHTAQTWAMVLDRLARYVETGTAQPLFPDAA